MKLQHWKIVALFLICFDAVAIAFSYFLGLWIRFDFQFSSIPKEYLLTYVRFQIIYIVGVIIFFWFMRMYRGIWRFAGFSELLRYAGSSLIASVAHGILISLFFRRMPFTYYFVGGVVQMILVVGIRFSYRFYNEVLKKRDSIPDGEDEKKVMIIGAGAAGRTVVRELLHTEKADLVPRCIIDDNPNKWNRFIEGVPVVGGRDDIPSAVEEYGIGQICFCIPTASAKERKDILEICKETGCVLKSLPGIYQLASDEVLVSMLKPVALEDLLGREPVSVNMDEIFQNIRGKVILVTGGGGSIGSELCRQIADHEPAQLIIFDIYENTTYQVELELRERYPELNLAVLIGSVRDSKRVKWVFETYHPDIVYHAAAHKHVPLMESSPNEAIKNNVFGTYKTAYAALQNGAERFVLISTDKAVNPTNIMGASKRLCEMIVQSMDEISRSGNVDMLPRIRDHEDGSGSGGAGIRERTHTRFVAVRFGNVLGSNGSVVPRFQAQIAAGGPVTVTHPDVMRFFMTIPEAVSLVLQAGTYAKGGEIFVLDMGEPVKIDTLARNLIQLSGYTPDEDIEIVYTGLRPGEKLYEEKLMAEEGMQMTENRLIFIGQPIPIDIESFMKELENLAEACYENSSGIVRMVENMVPTFHPVGEHPDAAGRSAPDAENDAKICSDGKSDKSASGSGRDF